MKQTGRKEQIVANITGSDLPGLTTSIMSILAKYDATVLDIGQADIHNSLSLGVMFRIDEQNSGHVMKELLFKATELGVNIGFSPISDDEYEEWVNRQGKNRYILTILGKYLEARKIEAATQVISEQGFNIDYIRRLTGRPCGVDVKILRSLGLSFLYSVHHKDRHFRGLKSDIENKNC